MGDVSALTSLLAENVSGWGDGGGVRQAARRPTVGRDAVIRLVTSGFAKWFQDIQFTYADINGATATLLWLNLLARWRGHDLRRG